MKRITLNIEPSKTRQPGLALCRKTIFHPRQTPITFGRPRYDFLLLIFGICYVLFWSNPAYAQPIEVSGYWKNFALLTDQNSPNPPSYLYFSRPRFQFSLDPAPFVHSEIWIDSDFQYGNFLRRYQAFSSDISNDVLWNTEWSIITKPSYAIRQRLYRAFVTFYPGSAQVTVGKQRVGWGSGFVWNPTDVLNPINPVSLERSEKQGVEAVWMTMPVFSQGQIEAVVAPGKKSSQSSYAIKGSVNWHTYDISFLGGSFRDKWLIGSEFAGYVGNAGLRGEWAVTWSKQLPATLRATLNSDYNFAHDYYVFAEFHFNGPGASDPSSYDYFSLARGQLFNLARLYSAAGVTKSVSPLTTVNFYAINNLNDQSGLLGPGVVWSISENAEVALSSYFFYGNKRTEYGQSSTVWFVSVQYFF